MSRMNFLLPILMALALLACERKPAPAAADPQKMLLPVTVLEMNSTQVPIQSEAVAQTEGAKEVEIRPRVGGILLKRLYNEGESVKAGQTMFRIDPAPFEIALQQAKAAYAAAKARVEQTSREEKRLKGLLASQSISQREFDIATSDAATAQANLLQAQASVKEAELNLSYTNVVAPVSGVSGRFQFSEGALVSANTSLLTTIAQIDPIWVRFSLSETELAAVGGFLNEQKVKQVSLILPDGSEYPVKGKINFTASQIDPNLGTQQLRASFENPQHNLLPGQFVRARVVTGQRDGVFLLPLTAVLNGEQGKFVFVAEKQGDASIAQVRPIQEAGWYQNQWVVVGGLKQVEQVVVDNLIKVRPGAGLAPHAAANPANAAPQGDSCNAAAAHVAKH